MTQISALLEQLKKVLKANGLTYKDVGQCLSLSESSIKRTFTKDSMSLDRLEMICEMVNIELSDLLDMTKGNQLSTQVLPYEFEKELVLDTKLLLTAHLLINKWTVHQIINHYDIKKIEMTRLLSRLDKMKIIDYLPHEKVRMKLTRDFNWIDNGPIHQFFNKHIEQEFFQCTFTSPGEIKLFTSGMLSRESNAEMQRKIHKLNDQFNELHKQDEKVELDDKFGSSLCVAMRPWDIKLFSNLRKSGTYKTF